MLGPHVETGETPQSAGLSLATGQGFVVAPAIYGPEGIARIRSLAELAALFGPREGENQKLYDAANAAFAIGLQTLFVKRTSGEGAPAAGKRELLTAGGKKALNIAAKYNGTYGNQLKVKLEENAGKTAVKLIIFNPAAEVLEQSPEFAKAEELLAWGKLHEAYVVITEGAEYAGGKAEKLEKLEAIALAGGANPTNNQKATIKSIEAFPKNLGPGQLWGAR